MAKQSAVTAKTVPSTAMSVETHVHRVQIHAERSPQLDTIGDRTWVMRSGSPLSQRAFPIPRENACITQYSPYSSRSLPPAHCPKPSQRTSHHHLSIPHACPNVPSGRAACYARPRYRHQSGPCLLSAQHVLATFLLAPHHYRNCYE